MSNFNYHYFWNDVDIVEAKKKVSKIGKLNCASNELIHHDLACINDDMIKVLDVNLNNCYIYYPDKMVKFSKLLQIPPENLQLFSGSDDAIKIVLTALGINCENIIIQSPNYENYYCYARLNGYKIVQWNMDDTYHFAVSKGIELLEQIGVSIVILTTPNGFTGFTMTLEDITSIIEVAYSKNSIVVIDQAYAPFAKINYIKFALKYDNVIVISTLSKGLGLAGARLAYTCTCTNIASYLTKWNGINSVSALSYEIGEYYLSCKSLDKIINDILQERNEFIDFINTKTPWIAYPSKANFVLINLGSEKIAIGLSDYFNENDIIVRRLMINPFKNCVRITIVDHDKMQKIKAVIIKYAAGRSH